MLLNFNFLISGINLSSFSKQNSITVSNNKLNIKVAFKLFNEGLIRGYKYNSKKITIVPIRLIKRVCPNSLKRERLNILL
jgi:hypothetical protein